MPGLKLEQFKGVAPKVAPEHLADGLGQIAQNTKLDSGDIIPYPEPVVVGSTGRSAAARTIYPLTNPTTGDPVWLSWETNVDVATPAFEPVVAEQRVYYTGDGIPKVTTYNLATSGGPPYPHDYYELGLPLPEGRASATINTFSAKTITEVGRDSSGIATFTTSTDHELKSGMVVAVTGFSHNTGTYSRTGNVVVVTAANHGLSDGATLFITVASGDANSGAYTIYSTSTNTFSYLDSESGATSGTLRYDTRSFNTTGAEVIVVDDTHFKLFLPGFEQGVRTSGLGTKVELAGQTYARTYTYTWYTPWGEESVGADPSDDLVIKEGTSVTVSDLPSSPPVLPAKNFIRGIRLYRTLAGLRETDFYLLKTLWFPQHTATVASDGTTVTVTMQEPHNFLVGDRFKLTGCTNSDMDITGGSVTEVIDSYTFTFTKPGSVVATTADTTGTLYHDASEREDDDPRYWGDSSFDFLDDFSSKYLTDNLVSDEWIGPPEDLQGLTVIQNNILAGFVRNSLYMTEPDQPHAWPEAYIKVLDVDIVAIRAISGVGALVLTQRHPYVLTGSDPTTMTLQRVDALYPCISAQGAVSMNLGVVYPTYEGLAIYSPAAGIRLATAAIYNSDEWAIALDPTTLVGVYHDNSYFASHDGGSFVYMYDQESGGSFVNCDTVFTAAYNDAKNGKVYLATGTSGDIVQWDAAGQPPQTAVWKSKKLVGQEYTNIGAARIKADYSDTTTLTFTMWADGVEVFSHEIYDDKIFRLPRGYRADTFEVAVEGNTRVKSIHLGQAPLSLKEV